MLSALTEVTKELAAYTESQLRSIISCAWAPCLEDHTRNATWCFCQDAQSYVLLFHSFQVEGFANADVLRGTAFGVAATASFSFILKSFKVPEIDLVVSADSETLEQQLQGNELFCM